MSVFFLFPLKNPPVLFTIIILNGLVRLVLVLICNSLLSYVPFGTITSDTIGKASSTPSFVKKYGIAISALVSVV